MSFSELIKRRGRGIFFKDNYVSLASLNKAGHSNHQSSCPYSQNLASQLSMKPALFPSHSLCSIMSTNTNKVTWCIEFLLWHCKHRISIFIGNTVISPQLRRSLKASYFYSKQIKIGLRAGEMPQESSCCSYKGPRFGSGHPHHVTHNCSISPGQIPPFDLQGHGTCVQLTYIQTLKPIHFLKYIYIS